MSLPPKRLAAEGLPVAATLLFWTAASWLLALDPTTAGAVRDAGVVMATLHVIVRGISLAPRVSPPSVRDAGSVLRENARVAVPAGAWFVAAAAVHLIAQLWTDLRAPGLFVSSAEPIAFVLAGAGVGVVGLYAVAVATTVVRREASGAPGGVSGGD
jgi:hypothetical protein